MKVELMKGDTILRTISRAFRPIPFKEHFNLKRGAYVEIYGKYYIYTGKKTRLTDAYFRMEFTEL